MRFKQLVCIFFVLFLFMFVVGCAQNLSDDVVTNNSLNIQCVTDADCIAAGCSGEICQPADFPERASICIYNPEYECLKFVSCGCIDGSCGWSSNEKYISCLKNTSDSEQVISPV